MRRQSLLFVTAILVPCVVLVILGLRMIAQERQLEEKRIADDRQRAVEQFGQKLLSRLEAIKQQQLTSAVAADAGAIRPQGAVVFAGVVRDGRLELPWENTPSARQFREWINDGDFARNLQQADKEELIERRHERAIEQYRSLLKLASEPAKQSFVRLSLARALVSAGHRDESRIEYERVLTTSPGAVDENDIPLALYAIPPLLDDGSKKEEILSWIRLAADRDRSLSPAALYMVRDFSSKLAVSEAQGPLGALIQQREQAEALQRDFQSVLGGGRSREPHWKAYGDSVWLTSITPPFADFDGLLVAVSATDVLSELSTSNEVVRLAAATDEAGVSLGDNLSGLRIRMPAMPQSRSTRQTFLIVALIASLAFTVVAGYLLWRDVQRDLRLSEMRSQFVSSVSHELKTPLTAIRMFTETLLLDEEVDRQTRMDYLDTILHESERLSRLVDNVLDFGKIERGRKNYRFQNVRLEQVVEHAARAAQYPLEQAGFVLDIEAQPDIPVVSADPDALQQAILNLLINAMKYSGDSRRIALSLTRKNGHACIDVVDHGIGIAPEDQSRIFDRFYRAPTAENQHIPGTGLGLTIVAHIAKAHGGRVEVSSTPGQGSAFTISLPLGVGGPARSEEAAKRCTERNGPVGPTLSNGNTA
jgi:signal transduction histidine kinase/tetratricopeptide (TPR) repeat protein